MATSLAGNWSAVNLSGSTVYQSNGVTVQPPVSLAAGTSLQIMSGATVIGLSSYGVNIIVSNGGILSGSTIVDGGVALLSGGVTSGNMFNSIPTDVYSGASSFDDTWYNSGYANDSVTFHSGATIGNVDLGNGGVASIQPGVTIKGDVTVAAGGTLTTYAGFGRQVVVPDTPPPSTGTTLAGTWSAVLLSGVTVYQSGTTTVQAPVALANGMNLLVQSGAVVTGLSGYGVGVYVSNGGTFKNSFIRDGGMTVFSGGTTISNQLNSIPTVYYSGARSYDDLWYNSGYGNDSVNVASGAIINNPSIGSGGVMSGAPGAVITTPAVADGGVLVANNTTVTACFLKGTLILTERGEVPVESLAVGDLIACEKDGHIVYRPIEWMGCELNNFAPYNPDDLSGYPIRICANALGDHVPHADLLITAEHCLYIQGRFIPARMLVNDISIYYDRTRPIYHYYHVELEEHAIIIANGVRTESYLNTGHEGLFEAERSDIARKSWENDGAADLDTRREFVEPIHAALRNRAVDLFGESNTVTRSVISYDADLHLITKAGKKIRPLRWSGNTCVFLLPAGASEVMLVSRASRPCDSIGPFVDDRRRLGVRVGRISLFAASAMIELEDHLTIQPLKGWHDPECSASRWTDGLALLKIGQVISIDTALLTVEVEEVAPHLEDYSTERQIRTA